MGAGDKLLGLGPFSRGVNNRRPDYDLSTKEGDFLRAGVNVDIGSTGMVTRRKGYTRLIEGADCHSLWSDGKTAFFVDDTSLKRASSLDTTPIVTELLADMARGRPVSYQPVGPDVVFSNGVTIGRLSSRGAKPLGCPGLNVDPDVGSGTGGSLPAGTYQLCFTLVNEEGEQSGSTPPVAVTVPANGVILIAGLPDEFPDGVVGLMVYASPLNSDLLMHVTTLATPAATYSIPVPMTYGARCPTLMLAPMPAGNIVREINGRLLVVAGNALYYSEPYNHALMNPERNYVVFGQDITVLEPAGRAGFFLVADKTYWIGSDIAGADLIDVLPYGAVPWTGVQVPDENACMWMSHRGLVRGNSAGEVVNVQADNIAVGKSAAGASLFREVDGHKQVLSSLFKSEQSGAAARSYMSAEIVRKGTTL